MAIFSSSETAPPFQLPHTAVFGQTIDAIGAMSFEDVPAIRAGML